MLVSLVRQEVILGAMWTISESQSDRIFIGLSDLRKMSQCQYVFNILLKLASFPSSQRKWHTRYFYLPFIEDKMD